MSTRRGRDIAVTNCVFKAVVQPANKHTARAISALADAIKANADAITAVANALKGGNATMNTGIRVSGKEFE